VGAAGHRYLSSARMGSLVGVLWCLSCSCREKVQQQGRSCLTTFWGGVCMKRWQGLLLCAHRFHRLRSRYERLCGAAPVHMPVSQAVLGNQENVVMIENPKLVHDFSQCFEKLWSQFRA